MKKIKSLLPVYVRGLITGKYTLREAAESTGYSQTWLCLLKRRVMREGLSVLDHGNKYRVPANKKPPELRSKIAAIYAGDYSDVNYSYFREILAEFHDIKISRGTLASILHEFKLYSPETRRVKKIKVHRRSRPRRRCFGDMIQIDGTPFPWFSKWGDEKKYDLMGAIDDATGKITGLYMSENECLYGYMEILRATCKTYGVPREVYSDRAAIFCVTPREKKNLSKWEELAGIHDKRTQWQRILSDLHIRQTLAWSPEAKGRVERMWRTVQGQLPIWFKLHGIKNMTEANKALPLYIKEFNSKYAVEPARPLSFFLPAPGNLDDILCAQFPRKTDRCGGFSFHSYKFEVLAPVRALKNFTLCITDKGLSALMPDGKYYEVRLLDDLLDGRDETMPEVLRQIIWRNLFAYAKEISI